MEWDRIERGGGGVERKGVKWRNQNFLTKAMSKYRVQGKTVTANSTSISIFLFR